MVAILFWPQCVNFLNLNKLSDKEIVSASGSTLLLAHTRWRNTITVMAYLNSIYIVHKFLCFDEFVLRLPPRQDKLCPANIFHDMLVWLFVNWYIMFHTHGFLNHQHLTYHFLWKFPKYGLAFHIIMIQPKDIHIKQRPKKCHINITSVFCMLCVNVKIQEMTWDRKSPQNNDAILPV